jgi:hypothetical protein
MYGDDHQHHTMMYPLDTNTTGYNEVIKALEQREKVRI